MVEEEAVARGMLEEEEEEEEAVARGMMEEEEEEEEREGRGECVTMRWVGVWDVLGNLIKRVV